MSFNFENFMSAMAKLLPAVGEAVIALHPNSPNEALKIQVGTQLISMIAASLHQSTSAVQATGQVPPAEPETTPAVTTVVLPVVTPATATP